jgi:hypothetical protein
MRLVKEHIDDRIIVNINRDPLVATGVWALTILSDFYDVHHERTDEEVVNAVARDMMKVLTQNKESPTVQRKILIGDGEVFQDMDWDSLATCPLVRALKCHLDDGELDTAEGILRLIVRRDPQTVVFARDPDFPEEGAEAGLLVGGYRAAGEGDTIEVDDWLREGVMIHFGVYSRVPLLH